jgi:hypothetical protein
MKINLLEEYNNVLKQDWVTVGKDVQFAVNNDTLYLQCSASFSDWIYNIMIKKIPYDDIKAHKGFTLLWLSAKEEIEKLTFTKIVAYSQGGGIAYFVHENYYHRFGKEPEYTLAFGTPPTFYKYKHKEKFHNFYNIHNYRDIVFWITQVFGYKPLGRNISLKAKAKRPANTKFFYWYSGHSPEEYKQRLRGLVI